MRFLRHSGIYRSDVLPLLLNSGQGAASRWSGPAQAIGRDGKSTPCPSSARGPPHPTDTETYVDRDGNLEIRYCRPRAKTKFFAIVTPTAKASSWILPETQKRPNWCDKAVGSHAMKSLWLAG
jgi:hypothetical protein